VLSRERLQKLAEELLQNPIFAQALGTALQKGMETKGRVDRNIETMLGLLNLPSRADLRKINTKIEVLQGTLANLTRQVEKLVVAEDRRRARRAARRAQSRGEA